LICSDFGWDPVENEGKMSRIHLDSELSFPGSRFGSVERKIGFFGTDGNCQKYQWAESAKLDKIGGFNRI
jgi:hypothetical protein